MTHVTIVDLHERMGPLLTSRARPSERFREAQTVLFGQTNLPEQKRAIQGLMADKQTSSFAVAQAVQLDGSHVMDGWQAWGLFNPGRTPDASEWQLQQITAIDLPGLVQRHLGEIAAVLGSAAPERLECHLPPADPANRSFMARSFGVSSFAGLPERLFLQLWPSEGNVARLGAILARGMVQASRLNQVGHATLRTLGDYLAYEGLASAFAGARAPLEPAPWAIPFRPTADWPHALAHVAEMLGVTAYDDLVTNIYGNKVTAADTPALPAAVPMDTEERAYAEAVIAEALEVTDTRTIAAYLYGDEIVAAQGHPSVGLPPYAGFEVAHGLVTAWLDRTHSDWPTALATPTREILAQGS